MITLSTLKLRVLQVLDDPNGTRFGSGLLDESVRLALDALDQRLPRLANVELAVTAAGRDQPITGIEDCLYLVSLYLSQEDRLSREMEPETEFSYLFREGLPTLHFSGRLYPKGGETLHITYAARHTLQGLDGTAATSLPAAYETALVNGAAGQACLLRAARLVESYGVRSNEAPRLMELSRLHLDSFERTLNSLKVLQEFGFPPGFALDSEDSQKTGRCP
jgi:hypothetical protein